MDVLLTLDYEMCNGLDSGTVQNCLITPTEELLKVLDKYNFKATFFVDTCFLIRLKQLKDSYPELEKDWDLITNQISRLAKEGHDIELHLHPNWYNATYIEGKWHSIMDDYKLSDMSPEVVDSMFSEGINLLESLTRQKVVAFRAGAYCLQTLKNYPDIFRKHGIKIDSSVNRYHSTKTEKWEWYDYMNIPSKYKYHFCNDVCVEDSNGDLIEVSIPSHNISFVNNYIARYRISKSSLSRKPWGDGKASVGGALYTGFKKLWVRIKAHLKPIFIVASIDSSSSYYLDSIYKKEKKAGYYLLIMGHPKCLTPFSLRLFDEFLDKRSCGFTNVVINMFS